MILIAKRCFFAYSKINYLDPRYVTLLPHLEWCAHLGFYRITVAWCKAHDVPVEKLFSKTLLTKCTLSLSGFCPSLTDVSIVPWAMEVDTEWKF